MCPFYHALCRYFGSTRNLPLIRSTYGVVTAGYLLLDRYLRARLQTAIVFLQEHYGKLPVKGCTRRSGGGAKLQAILKRP